MNVSLSSSIEYFKWPFKNTNKNNGFANSVFVCSVKNKQTQLGFAKPKLGFAKLNILLMRRNLNPKVRVVFKFRKLTTSSSIVEEST
jgi:hypothetical protein